jgi:hypothetical protein
MGCDRVSFTFYIKNFNSDLSKFKLNAMYETYTCFCSSQNKLICMIGNSNNTSLIYVIIVENTLIPVITKPHVLSEYFAKFVNAERAIQFAVATKSSICSVQNHGIGTATAKSNDDACMIDHILIEYYSYLVIFYYKVNVNIKSSCSLT